MKKRQPVLALKPTQFSIGILEVESKLQNLMKMTKSKRQEFAFSKPIPVVISPVNTLYVLDHHHHIFSCWLAGVRYMHIKVVHDLSQSEMPAKGTKKKSKKTTAKPRLNFLTFWKKMEDMNCVHLLDQFGEGPRSPLYLPQDIRGMADDPYRSLAWVVRKEGGYIATGKTFAEFQWANYFRKHQLMHDTGRRGLHQILNEALLLAQSPAAKKLPGYKPNKKLLEETKQRIAKGKDAKTKFVFGGHSKNIGGTQPEM